MATLICDTEIYKNFFLVAFKRIEDGKVVTLEMSDRSQIDLIRLNKLMRGARIITYNGLGFDLPLIFYALTGATTAQLKDLCDRIIIGRLKWWEVERELGFRIPKIDHIDLMEPQPNAVASLKALNGRLHGRKMQDLPIAPDAVLTHEQMDLITAYCGNDLDATELLFEALAEPISMREALGREYDTDFRSKSDSQIGEAIVRKRVEALTGEPVKKLPVPAGTKFHYDVPEFIRFETPALQAVLARVRETEFTIRADGRVEMPKALDGLEIVIGSTTYAMGIGGLHSTESKRAIVPHEDYLLIDADVASQYPSIILKLGLYPKALGRHFLSAYAKIKHDRMIAKRAGDSVRDRGGKIALNGVYGKLGSPYSILYAPHLMIAVTLTGQLTLLMLAERAEAAGISVVSGNTDGVLFRCPRRLTGGVTPKKRLEPGVLADVCAGWEAATGFDLEFAEYRAVYNASVNSYFAIKADGKIKAKGPVANPWAPGGDLRDRMMKNPQAFVLSDAVQALLLHGTPVETTICACTDPRAFVTVIKESSGATWRGEYLGKTVRYYWSTDGDPILGSKPHASTGNVKQVSKTEGAKPLMDLPDALPGDVDFDRYIAEARKILREIGWVDPNAPVVRGPASRRELMTWALAA